ncbi:MAG: hypothetical protein HY905_27840 [Deltaproteobacteria bacterium]|nr:hypothetical protein [Deltaproteobacteria bacterium]
MSRGRFVGLIVATGALAVGVVACDPGPSRLLGPDGGLPYEWIPWPAHRPVVRVDVAVLVDNSGSMSQEQSALSLRFPELIAELVDPADDDGDTFADHLPVDDLNIGVISSDMGTAGYRVSTCSISDVGDNGCFRNTPSPAVLDCETSYPPFLSRDELNAFDYDAATMAHDFTCIATLGTQGCGFEQPLKAMRAATSTNPDTGICNRGFLRPDALLALIWVTDEDDCSVRPDHTEMFDPTRDDLGHLNTRCFLHADFVESVPDYVDAFRALKPPEDQDQIVLGMIVGVPFDAPACIGDGLHLESCLAVPAMNEMIDPAAPTQLIPSCNTSMGTATPPRRFVELAHSFGSNAYVDSICKSDYADAVRGISRKIVEHLPSDCPPFDLPFDGTDDGDPAPPALCSADCFIVETLSDDRPCETDPACPPSSCPPATIGNALDPEPCIVPATGTTCAPLKRDLGLVRQSDGRLRRDCLIRQAARSWDGSRCGLPTEPGWTWEPREWSDAPRPCPVLSLRRGPGESLVDDGGRAALYCASRS